MPSEREIADSQAYRSDRLAYSSKIQLNVKITQPGPAHSLDYTLYHPAATSPPSGFCELSNPTKCSAHGQILFRGVPDGEMVEWQNRGVVHAEMGLDWRTA